jgi:hypothetical protein
MKARVSTRDDQDIYDFKEVEALKIIEIEGSKAFIVTTGNDEGEGFLYKIVDWESGYGMSTYLDSEEEAIFCATEICKKYGPEEVKRRADSAIAKHGRANE